MQGSGHSCTIRQSPHQLMYNLYNIIALTEIKGYAMLQFSYMMLKIYGKVGWTIYNFFWGGGDQIHVFYIFSLDCL